MKKKDKIVKIEGVRSDFCELDVQVHESDPDPSARLVYSTQTNKVEQVNRTKREKNTKFYHEGHEET